MTGNFRNICLTALTIVAYASQFYASAAGSAQLPVNKISKYVYPQNTPENPGKLLFLPDGLSYLSLDASSQKIIRYDSASGKELETVLDTGHTREASISSISDFIISPDGSKLLLYTSKEMVYRRSFRADWYTFEIKRNILRPLSAKIPMTQSPVFSPDSRMVAFVADNNIYIKKLDYNSQVQVTTDGSKNRIINGIPDWTYEEEFSTECSLAWSPDNQLLSYLKYDETDVPAFTFSLYNGWCEPDPAYALYPGQFSYKYPVAGKPNSMVSVHTYDVETRKTKQLSLNSPQIEYIPRLEYGYSDERLMVVTLNRAQNRMEIFAANPRTGVAKSILTEETKTWLDSRTYENITFTSRGFTIFSERSGWSHLYLYAYNGSLLRQITQGEFDVTAFYGTDSQGYDYFQSEPMQPGDTPAALNRTIYRIDSTGKKIELLAPAEGWSIAQFSPGCNFFILNHSTCRQSPAYTFCNAKGKALRVLEANESYAANYASAPPKEFLTLQSDGVTLNAYMIKPLNFTTSKKYPVIFWQYSGPGSQEVVNRWRMDWDYYAAMQGFIVVCVDGRGTGGRGAQFRTQVYKRLGYFETIDQINAAKYIASLPYVDASRLGIAGWSFGGYETLMSVTSPESPFSCAVAIAPVTSWRFYDTVYTERFMLTPGENPDGYDTSAPINRAANLNVPLLIIHGTADDNVHLSNSIEFAAALQANDRFCDMMLFPNMNHSINHCDARALVYARMIEYFKSNMR